MQCDVNFHVDSNFLTKMKSSLVFVQKMFKKIIVKIHTIMWNFFGVFVLCIYHLVEIKKQIEKELKTSITCERSLNVYELI